MTKLYVPEAIRNSEVYKLLVSCLLTRFVRPYCSFDIITDNEFTTMLFRASYCPYKSIFDRDRFHA